jgi:hypothetical protein
VSAGHVHEHANPAEVVDLQNRRHHVGAEGRHRVVEAGRPLRILRQILEERHAHDLGGARLTRANRVQHLAIGAKVQRVADELDAVAELARAFPHERRGRRERKGSRRDLGEDPGARQGSQHPVEPVLGHARACREIPGRLRSVCEFFDDLQFRSDVESRGHDVSSGSLKQQLRGSGIRRDLWR